LITTSALRVIVLFVTIFNVTTYCRFKKQAFPTVFFLVMGVANSLVWTLVSGVIYYNVFVQEHADVPGHNYLWHSAVGLLDALYMNIGLALSLIQYHILYVMRETTGD